MDLFLLNLQWMAFNASLAVIGASFGWLAIKSGKYLQMVLVILWLLFIPNTIYLVTDIAHLSWQLPASTGIWDALIFLQFILLAALGVVTFVVGVYPLEKIMNKTKLFRKKHIFVFTFIVINLMIGFGIILGRVYRIHSWYVFTKPVQVISSTLELLASAELTAISIVMGIIGFIVYFLLRDILVPNRFRKLR